MYDDDDFPVWVERTLISVAFTMSASLAILTGCQNWLQKRVQVEFLVVSFLALGCIISGVLGWVLFLSEDLSLDAFGVILIGLIPGFEALSRLRLGGLMAQKLIRKRPALRITFKDFSYLRHGRPPPDDVQTIVETAQKKSRLGNPAPLPKVQRNKQIDPETTYLRIPACSKRKAVAENAKMWFGTIVQYDEKMVTLRGDDDLGDAISWWKAACRAVNIVRSPAKADFSEGTQVTRALELVAEIAMIGDYVLHYHGEGLKKYVEQSDNLRSALHATPVSVCTAFLREIELLEEWGPINDAVRDEFIKAKSKTLRRRGKYGMLFFILLVESCIFQTPTDKPGKWFGFCKAKDEYTRASAVIKKFKESSEESDRRDITKEWLRQYFSDGDRFSNYIETQSEAGNGTVTNSSSANGLAGGAAVAAVQSDAGAGNVVISFRVDGRVLEQASELTIRFDDMIVRNERP